jgi:alpha-glucosidase
MLLGQRMVNSLGITGMSLVGVDIGGFSGDPTPELMVRWNSLGVYIPMFRNHAALGTKMREPWEWGDENEAIIKKDIDQRYRLLPYIYSGYYQSHQSGIPISRTLAINYTQDENVFDVKYQNQFLFGDSILVAPVESTALIADVYLPEGDWYRLSTGELFTGGKTANATAPLTDLPVFIKAGAIIPTQNVIQNTNDKGDGVLIINVWNGDDGNSFVYYEDDGSSYDYQKGTYYKRVLSFDPGNRLITLAQSEGSFTSKYNKIKLVLRGFEAGLKAIKINNDVIKFSQDRKNKNSYCLLDNRNEEVRINY